MRRVHFSLRLLLLFSPLFSSLLSLANPVALVISGGIDPSSNHAKYYQNISRVENSFESWEIANLVADGPESDKPNSVDHDKNGGLEFDSDGLPKLKRFAPRSNYVGAATYKEIKSALEAKLRQLKPGEPVMFYFTDHGDVGTGPGDRRVCLWGENMTVTQLQSLLNLVPRGNKVVLVNDQCFGGGMLEALWQNGTLRPNTCGFAAATANQWAFDGGGVMEAIEKFCGKEKRNNECTFQDAYRHLVTTGHWTRASTPLSSSDLYLEKFLADQGTHSSRVPMEVVCENPNTPHEEVPCQLDVQSLKVILEGRLEQLKKDIKDAHRVINDPSISVNNLQDISDELVSRVGEHVKRQEDKVYSMEKELNDLKRQDHRALLDWLSNNVDRELFEHYSKTKSEIDQLTSEKTAHNIKPDLKHKIEAKLTKLQSEFAPVQEKIRLYKVAANHGSSKLNRDFKTFLERNQTSQHYPVHLLENIEKKDKEVESQREKLKPAWRLHRDLQVARGLQSLLKTGNPEAIRHYSNLVNCEETSIHNTHAPPSEKGGKRHRT